jgi:hypothetical protein
VTNITPSPNMVRSRFMGVLGRKELGGLQCVSNLARSRQPLHSGPCYPKEAFLSVNNAFRIDPTVIAPQNGWLWSARHPVRRGTSGKSQRAKQTRTVVEC